MNVILSIKPQFVQEIIAGRKKFEFRKKIFKQQIHKVYIYSSSPECKIIGEFVLGAVVEGSPMSVWKKTNKHSGITKAFFDSYFLNRKIAYALKIDDFIRYEKPVNPYTVLSDFTPPQSYRYVENLNLK